MSFSRPHPFPHHDNSASIGGASCRRIHYRPSDRTAAAAAAATTNGDLSRKHHLGVDHTAFDAAAGPPLKRRRQQQHRQPVYAPWEETHRRDQLGWQHRHPVYVAGNGPSTSGGDGRRAGSDGVIIHGDGGDMVFMSRDDIERCSPSRRDGIDSMRETQLRYSYCAFLRNLGLRLQLPQTTIGTAMVLCHRFFFRRSHANHDRFLIATAALFLAAKSEETPCPLDDVLKASCELCHKQDFTFFSYLLPVDWFKQYKERVLEAEQMILMTLNFELDVQHPYDPLTSVLKKLGLSQTALLNMAFSLVSEGLRTSLWLQFKPHHIAAGAAFLAAKCLNFDLALHHNMYREFKTTPCILQDVVQQLMELF